MAIALGTVLVLFGLVHSLHFHHAGATEAGRVYYLQKDNPTHPIRSVLNKILEYSPLPAWLPYNGYGVHSAAAANASDPATSLPPDPAGLTCGIAPPSCGKSRYRSIDGSCNNLQSPVWGTPQTPYGRLLPFNYADGISAWPVSSTGAPLPNARTLSLALFPDLLVLVDPVWNLNAQQWGQIMTHDMSLTAFGAPPPPPHEEPVTCCVNGQLAPATNPQCRPILIPLLDPVHGPLGTKCLPFSRTTSTRDRGCTPPTAPAAPLTVVTAFMDMSHVYGSSVGQASPLREHSGGRLLTVLRGGREWPPQHPNITVTCGAAQSPNEPCYLSGDVRMNQNPQLTVLHIILLREHNRLADALAQLNPHWSDETIFQEARRVNIAQYQYINYYEWLPIFLGTENMIKNKLIYPGVHGYVNDYNPKVNPSVLAEHATAAFRHFHTLIRGFLQLIAENRHLLGTVRLSDWFNRPLLLEIGNSFEDLTRGLTAQKMDASDQWWTNEITQYLFRGNNTAGGDLRAADVQRGRDHGLASYVDTRRACGLSVPKTFIEMTKFISAQNVIVLKTLYPSPKDVDLVVGGSLERNVQGALVGPTYLCILTEQFSRTRVGDRFFFENGADPDTAFTLGQLEAIRRGASMARLLCDNTDSINIMQPKAFEQIRSGNQLVPCGHLPIIDLSLWKDTEDASIDDE